MSSIFIIDYLMKLTYLKRTKVVSFYQDIVELVDYSVAVDVCGRKLVLGKISRFEIMALNQNVVELVDCTVCVNVAESVFGLGSAGFLRDLDMRGIPSTLDNSHSVP